MLLEIECVVCVLFDHLENLDRLRNDLIAMVNICENKYKEPLLPLDRRRHLDAISAEHWGRCPTNVERTG